jgi:hypothetical protein
MYTKLAGKFFTATAARPGGMLEVPAREAARPSAACAGWGQAGARKVLDWPRRCKLAHAFQWEYSHKRLKLGQLLGQLGVFLTWAAPPCASRRAPARGGVATFGLRGLTPRPAAASSGSGERRRRAAGSPLAETAEVTALPRETGPLSSRGRRDGGSGADSLLCGEDPSAPAWKRWRCFGSAPPARRRVLSPYQYAGPFELD